MMASYGAE
uniref:Uncharacterized protein n=1 Tax=Anguilla anguilla TaxID=7936 RepID=A0A0E9UYB4_ANGAN